MAKIEKDYDCLVTYKNHTSTMKLEKESKIKLLMS